MSYNTKYLTFFYFKYEKKPIFAFQNGKTKKK